MLCQKDFDKDSFPTSDNYPKAMQPAPYKVAPSSSEGSMSRLKIPMLFWLGKANSSVLWLLNKIASIELNEALVTGCCRLLSMLNYRTGILCFVVGNEKALKLREAETGGLTLVDSG